MYDGVYYIPLGRFSKVDSSTAKRVPKPNDTSSENSRREVFNADLFGTDPIPTAVEICTDHGKSAQGCVIHIVVYSTRRRTGPCCCKSKFLFFIFSRRAAGEGHHFFLEASPSVGP